MRYIKIENNSPIHYSIEQLMEDIPDAVIYEKSELPSEKLLKNYDVYPLVTTPFPEADVVEEGTPIFSNGEWIQTWITREFTQEERLEYENTREKSKISDRDNFFKPFLENQILFVDSETQANRYDICKSCDKFFELTKQCKECGCFMTLKTKLKMTSCPLNKW